MLLQPCSPGSQSPRGAGEELPDVARERSFDDLERQAPSLRRAGPAAHGADRGRARSRRQRRQHGGADLSRLPDLNWAGFYFARGDELVLGPFQGKPACIRIPWGEGVCGAAARRGASSSCRTSTIFPGHIACDRRHARSWSCRFSIEARCWACSISTARFPAVSTKPTAPAASASSRCFSKTSCAIRPEGFAVSLRRERRGASRQPRAGRPYHRPTAR